MVGLSNTCLTLYILIYGRVIQHLLNPLNPNILLVTSHLVNPLNPILQLSNPLKTNLQLFNPFNPNYKLGYAFNPLSPEIRLENPTVA